MILLVGRALPSQSHQTAVWGAPSSLVLNSQDQHWRKAREMPGSQFNVMEMTTEAILTHIPHSSECTWMLNCHLLFSLALLCQRTGHCHGKCDGSCVSEWKTLFPCCTSPRQQKSRSHFRAWIAKRRRKDTISSNSWGFHVLCTEAPEQRGFTWVTQGTHLCPQPYPVLSVVPSGQHLDLHIF